MPVPLTAFPPLPAETVHAAEAVFGKGNFYLTIGDQAGRLLTDLNFADLDSTGRQPIFFLARLSLVTVFQYVEDLPDRQAPFPEMVSLFARIHKTGSVGLGHSHSVLDDS